MCPLHGRVVWAHLSSCSSATSNLTPLGCSSTHLHASARSDSSQPHAHGQSRQGEWQRTQSPYTVAPRPLRGLLTTAPAVSQPSPRHPICHGFWLHHPAQLPASWTASSWCSLGCLTTTLQSSESSTEEAYTHLMSSSQGEPVYSHITK